MGDDREEKGNRRAPRKYRFGGEFEPTNVADFFQKWTEDALPVYMRTEAAPTGDAMYDQDVLVTVGMNYEDTVNENPHKFVMMQLYGSQQRAGSDAKLRQQKLAPEYSKLAKQFKDQTDVIVAKIDVTRNEIGQFVVPTGIQVKRLPTMILYPKQHQYDEENTLINIPVEYKGDWTAEAMTRWIDARRVLELEENAPTVEQSVDVQEATADNIADITIEDVH